MHATLLIIGAGPFGLAMAAHAKHLGIDFIMVGKPMEFWKANMPEGMYLRSECDWHFDTRNEHTIEQFLSTKNLTPEDVKPIARDFYLLYADWFSEQKGITASPVYVTRLDRSDEGYRAVADDGSAITADNVVIATGFKYFQHIPEEFVQLLPPGAYTHTCDFVDMKQMQGKRCLILGGRQSAFEWAALLHEADATMVHVVHRHPSPAFAAADWAWVNPIVDNMVNEPGWYRRLSQDEKDKLNKKLRVEGRLKVEPWLEARIAKRNVKLWPNAEVVACKELPEKQLKVTLRSAETIIVDHVICATGYKVIVDRIPFLAQGNVLPQIAVRNGFPELDEHFQTSLPGLFMTSLPAAQDFGPFFGFSLAVRSSAILVGKALSVVRA